MKRKEREVLQKLVEDPRGLLSPADFINGTASRDEGIVHRLIADGYVEEVPTRKNEQEYTFYRASSKGRLRVAPLYTRFWIFISNDMRQIIVAAITALIVTLVTNMIQK